MNKLIHFLTDLAANPKKQQAFLEHPERMMAAAGLSEVEQIIIQSGDKAKITAACADEFTPLAYTFGDPGPDPSPDPDPPDDD
jgi:hypothetical protein